MNDSQTTGKGIGAIWPFGNFIFQTSVTTRNCLCHSSWHCFTVPNFSYNKRVMYRATVLKKGVPSALHTGLTDNWDSHSGVRPFFKGTFGKVISIDFILKQHQSPKSKCNLQKQYISSFKQENNWYVRAITLFLKSSILWNVNNVFSNLCSRYLLHKFTQYSVTKLLYSPYCMCLCTYNLHTAPYQCVSYFNDLPDIKVKTTVHSDCLPCHTMAVSHMTIRYVSAAKYEFFSLYVISLGGDRTAITAFNMHLKITQVLLANP